MIEIYDQLSRLSASQLKIIGMRAGPAGFSAQHLPDNASIASWAKALFDWMMEVDGAAQVARLQALAAAYHREAGLPLRSSLGEAGGSAAPSAGSQRMEAAGPLAAPTRELPNGASRDARHEVCLTHQGERRFLLTGLGTGAPSRVVDLSGLDPYAWPSQSGQGSLMEELNWQLNAYAAKPHRSGQGRAPSLSADLVGWGQDLADAIWGEELPESLSGALPPLRIIERRRRTPPRPEDDVLSWPWEALELSAAGPWGVQAPVLRSTARQLGAEQVVSAAKLRVLLVSPRATGTREVSYRAVAEPLLELIARDGLAVELTELPTADLPSLLEALGRGERYHVVHFDGHGEAGGALLFEPPRRYGGVGGGALEAATAGALVTALRGKTDLFVMTACRSAAVEESAAGTRRAVSSAAEAISHAVDSVVAMKCNLHVHGARHFVEGFYGKLLRDGGTVGEAVQAASYRMFADRVRRTGRERPSIEDWVNPQLLTRRPLRFAPAAPGPRFAAAERCRIPNDGRWPLTGGGGSQLPDGFWGRDVELHKLVRTWARQDSPVIQLHGAAECGKSTLARWALLRLARTGLIQGRVFRWSDELSAGRGAGMSEVMRHVLSQLEHERPKADLSELRMTALEHMGPGDVLLWDDFDPAAEAGGGGQRNLTELIKLVNQSKFSEKGLRVVVVGEQAAESTHVTRLLVETLDRDELEGYAVAYLDRCHLNLSQTDRESIIIALFDGSRTLSVGELPGWIERAVSGAPDPEPDPGSASGQPPAPADALPADAPPADADTLDRRFKDVSNAGLLQAHLMKRFLTKDALMEFLAGSSKYARLIYEVSGSNMAGTSMSLARLLFAFGLVDVSLFEALIAARGGSDELSALRLRVDRGER